MRYGFIIDNRKCIGCHACTTACKSEHQVPVGVNRTWVKQVEKGIFPFTRRHFSVLRCNHCTDAPCVEICPVEALYIRDDGIVDFDNRRCIGCKSCMQACPYDALYIDPNTSTAAKCNYCAPRIDVGLEPACVNVCPEHAIISGDMENPDTEIAQLLGRMQTTVRKEEKGTHPNLFYIQGEQASLTPAMTEKNTGYFWNSQEKGVGHFSKYTEKLATEGYEDTNKSSSNGHGQHIAPDQPAKSIDVLTGLPRRVYDAPDKGILWGWEVSSYVFTKAIAAGAILIPFFYSVFKSGELPDELKWWSIGIALVGLMATGLLLIKDLDQPTRFVNVLLRPQWKSWLVRGGYSITAYGALITLWALSIFFNWGQIEPFILGITALVAVIVAIYTAFLFAQAKGRDFWQSPMLVFHMLNHSVMAGAAIFGLLTIILNANGNWSEFIVHVLLVSIVFNLLIVLFELVTNHPTKDAKAVVKMITKGRYRSLFWIGTILIGNILPLIIMFTGMSYALPIAGLCVLIGIYATEKIWVEAPQRIALS